MTKQANAFIFASALSAAALITIFFTGLLHLYHHLIRVHAVALQLPTLKPRRFAAQQVSVCIEGHRYSLYVPELCYAPPCLHAT